MKKKIYLLSFGIAALAFLFLPVLAFGQSVPVNVQKVPSTNTLTGDLVVPSGKSLTIANGGTITVNGGATFTIPGLAPDGGATGQALVKASNADYDFQWGSPVGGAEWGAITGTLSDQTDLQNALNAKQASGNYVTALTGDGTASGPGSVAFTLATVNSNVGAFGSSTSIPTFTVNGKGLITAASGNAVVAPAGTLTGATLAGGVTASSLTSVGTLTGGATGSGFTLNFGTSTMSGTVPGANGGTGVANTGKTITLGGSLTTTGAFTLNFTVGANTSVTLPASGTLVGSADTGTVTNTMLAGSIANAKLSNSAITIAGTATSLGSSIALDTITGVGSNGIVARTTTNTLTPRTITGTAGEISVANGDGAAGDPTISLPSTITQNTEFSGAINISNTTTSTSSTTGALRVAGGVGVAENLNVGGTFGLTGAAVFSSTINGSNNLPQIAALADPNADRILFWDDSTGSYAHLLVGTGLSLSGTTLSTDGIPVTAASAATGANYFWTSTGADRAAVGTKAVPTGAVLGTSDTQTLTNKRITARIATLTDAATVTPDSDAYDGGILTTLSQATEIANPTGTPTDGQKYMLRIKSTTARALTYGSQFRGSTDLPLPSTTSGTSLTDYMVFIWNAADTKWDLAGKTFGF